MKTTRKQIDYKLETLNRLLGRPVAAYVEQGGKYTAQIGNIHLGKDAQGYSIEEMHNDGGGVSQPFGSYRLTAFECWAVLNAACVAAQMAKGKP